MEEITLESCYIDDPKTELFVIKNDKGFYLTNNGSYWTNNINRCYTAGTIRTKDHHLKTAVKMLRQKEIYKQGKETCFNDDLYSFEKLYLVKVDFFEVEQ